MCLLRGKFDDGLHGLKLLFRQESASLRLGEALNDLLSIISTYLFFKYTKRGSRVSLLEEEEDVARREQTARALLDRGFGLAWRLRRIKSNKSRRNAMLGGHFGFTIMEEKNFLKRGSTA